MSGDAGAVEDEEAVDPSGFGCDTGGKLVLRRVGQAAVREIQEDRGCCAQFSSGSIELTCPRLGQVRRRATGSGLSSRQA